MPIEQAEIDRKLVDLPPAVRRAAETRLHTVSSIEALSDLIQAAELDEKLAPLVAGAKDRDKGGREAFDDLWREIAPYLRIPIRVWIRCKTPEHVQAVEAQVMEAIWLNLGEYERDQGFFLTWARAYAKNQARWYKCRILGAEPPVLEVFEEDVYELPPSACFAELLDIVQDQEPCKAVAFLWNKYLDWKPSAIAAAYGDTSLLEVVAAIQKEMVARYPILVRVKATLTKLYKKTLLSPTLTLQEYMEPGRELVESITHWANDTKRALSARVIGQSKELLKLTCELRVGAHETLSFLWSRPLGRRIAELCAMANSLLLAILERFCDEYSRKTDLDRDEISACTSPLETTMKKAPKRRLADCSKGDLCADLAAWRDRIQTILLGPARDRHLVAFSYLCGCLPGINGPARRGV